LLVRCIGKSVRRRRLKPKLNVPSWLDPRSGGPG
jgi:hypothetical protein